MRAVMLAMLVACGTDEPVDVCTDALTFHQDKGCGDAFVGNCPLALDPIGCGIEACHRHEPKEQCSIQFNAWIDCLEKDSPLRMDCNCWAQADALVACVGE